MKNIILIFLVFICGSILNALEYHFPNNEISRSEGLLEIHFKGKDRGFADIISLLEKIPDLPSDYSEFLQYVKQREGSDEIIIDAVYANSFFEGGTVRWQDKNMRLDITESKFKRALQKLEIGEEENFYKTKLTSRRYRIGETTPAMIDINRSVPEPEILIMKCKRVDKQTANCWFVDEEGNEIKELVRKWDVSYPADLENQIKQEIKAAKQEKLKRDKQRDKKWEAMKKECPGLYRTLNFAQRGGYVDPVIGVKASKRFKELDCDVYLQVQLQHGGSI